MGYLTDLFAALMPTDTIVVWAAGWSDPHFGREDGSAAIMLEAVLEGHRSFVAQALERLPV